MLLDGARNATGLCWGVSQTEAYLSWISSGCYRSLSFTICVSMLSWYLVHLGVVVSVVPEYKLGIYSDRGQCPVSKGEGKTVFLGFLLKDAHSNAQNARSGDFSAYRRQTDKPIALPLAHVCGVKIGLKHKAALNWTIQREARLLQMSRRERLATEGRDTSW